MCGRTACTLDKHCIQHATCTYSKNNDRPKWIEKYDWQMYQPSHNLAPSQVSPVLISDYVVSPSESNGDINIMPMRWGLIPSWHKGSLTDFSMKTNNCRFESILERPTYKGALAAGQRCVILADGFYEWKANGKERKQPYFIYFPQKDGFKVFTKDSELMLENDSWKGPRLLTMAGIFDLWKNPKNEVIYSYSVITLAASKTVSFVHSRMPAILDGEKLINMWLDSKNIPIKEALSNLKPIDNLQMHPVSTEVNYSKNDSINCFLPLKHEKKEKPTIQQTALTSWLKMDSKQFNPSSAKRFKRDS